jgi:indolepyruvate ferredoxin oxidoreductase beta subunit
MTRARIFFTGVGGQGTLTATTLLARTALDAGLPVTSGEIHGMAQRGGVVESTLLVGGYKSAIIAPGEADVILGFELLETLRALPMLKRGGFVVGNSEALQPVGVCLGRARNRQGLCRPGGAGPLHQPGRAGRHGQGRQHRASGRGGRLRRAAV